MWRWYLHVLQFSVYLWVRLLGICASSEGCFRVSLCTCGVVSLLLFSSFAFIVFYTPIGTVCLCHIGNIVFNLVSEHIYVLVVVCVGMRLVKEFYLCVILLWSGVLLIKHCFVHCFA